MLGNKRCLKFLIGSLACVLISAAHSTAAPDPAKNIVLEFPKQRSIGDLYLVTNPNSLYWPGPEAKEIGPAVGKVVLKKGSLVDFRANYYGQQDLSPLLKLPQGSVVSLKVRNLEMTDDQLLKIKGLTSLRRLDLAGTEIKDGCIDVLNGMKDLVFLDISETNIQGKNLCKLKGLTAIKRLNLSTLPINDTSLANLRGMKNLQVLFLNGCKISNDGLKELSKLQALRELGVKRNNITDDGIKNLTQLKHLQILNLTGTKITYRCAAYLKELPQLRELTVSFADLGRIDVQRLNAALPKCHVVDGLNPRGMSLDFFQ